MEWLKFAWYLLAHGQMHVGFYEKQHKSFIRFYRDFYGSQSLNSLWIGRLCIEFHY